MSNITARASGGRMSTVLNQCPLRPSRMRQFLLPCAVPCGLRWVHLCPAAFTWGVKPQFGVASCAKHGQAYMSTLEPGVVWMRE